MKPYNKSSFAILRKSCCSPSCQITSNYTQMTSEGQDYRCFSAMHFNLINNLKPRFQPPYGTSLTQYLCICALLLNIQICRSMLVCGHRCFQPSVVVETYESDKEDLKMICGQINVCEVKAGRMKYDNESVTCKYTKKRVFYFDLHLSVAREEARKKSSKKIVLPTYWIIAIHEPTCQKVSINSTLRCYITQNHNKRFTRLVRRYTVVLECSSVICRNWSM